MTPTLQNANIIVIIEIYLYAISQPISYKSHKYKVEGYINYAGRICSYI